MTTEEQKAQIDLNVTDKTSVNSITPTNVGGEMKSLVDYIDDSIVAHNLQEVTDIGATTTNPITVNTGAALSGTGLRVSSNDGASSSLGFANVGPDNMGALSLKNKNANGIVLFHVNNTSTVPYFVSLPNKPFGSYNLPLTVNDQTADINGNINLGGGVESVTGDSVDNTDSANPIVNAIPLSGTSGANIVTGEIYFNEGVNLVSRQTGAHFRAITFQPTFIAMFFSQTYVKALIDEVLIESPLVSGFKGLRGNDVWDNHLVDESFVQKKYVDDTKHIGDATYSATSTAITSLDLSLFDSRYQILTVNTDIQFTNTPASGETFVKTLEVISTTAETLGFSTATKVIGEFVSDGATVNLITINFANYPTVGLRITVMINQ